MEHAGIFDAVNRAISSLDSEFMDRSTLFFTEHDVVSRLYSLIQEELNYMCVPGVGNNSTHYLVHHEYPTPFKCHMKNTDFWLMDETSSAKRGHYDIVVFNPEFLKYADYDLVRGQDYKLIRKNLRGVLQKFGDFPILIGIEAMFNRKSYTKARVERKAKQTEQDCAKLAASHVWDGHKYMKETRMLYYTQLPSDEIKARLLTGNFGSMIKYIAPPV